PPYLPSLSLHDALPIYYRTCFGLGRSTRIASVSRVEFFDRWPACNGSRRNFSSNAPFDPRTRKLTHRLRGRCQPELFASREFLVANRFRSCGLLFHLHLAALCRKGWRSARHSRLLLEERHDSCPLVRARRAIFSGTTRSRCRQDTHYISGAS